MNTLEQYISQSQKETLNFGKQFSKRITLFPACIFLEGPLGAGKTVFVRGMANGLHPGASHNIKSPTFTIINTYTYKNYPFLIHADFYRLETLDSIEINLVDYFYHHCIFAIEWPKVFKDFFLQNVIQAYNIGIKISNKNTRTFIIEKLPT